MSVSFTLLKAAGQRFDLLPGHDDREFSLSRQRRRRPRGSRHRRLLLRTPLADPLLPGAPHRRPAQAPRPRFPRHPCHRNPGAGDDAGDRVWPDRRLHRAKTSKSLRSRERRRRNRRNSCGMGLTPNPAPDDGEMLRMSGVPPSGSRSTRGFPPLTKPVAGLRPPGSRSLTLGGEGVPPPSPARPHGDRHEPSRGSPQFRQAQSAQAGARRSRRRKSNFLISCSRRGAVSCCVST